MLAGRQLYWIILWVLPLGMMAQPPGFYVDTLAPYHLQNRFPVVHSDVQTKVAEKINRYLQLTELQHLPGDTFLDHPFQKVGRDTLNWGPHVIYSMFEVFPTELPILSLTIEGTGIGTRAIDFWIYRNFNALNGDVLYLSDLVSQTGMKKLCTLYDSLFPYNAPHIELYEFTVRNDSIQITYDGERADGHLIDGTPDSYKVFGVREMEPYLSAYGKALLAGRHTSYKSRILDGSMYIGSIKGSGEAGLFINQVYDDGSVNGYLWFQTYPELIDLSGHVMNDSLFELYHTIDWDDETNSLRTDHHMTLILHGNQLMEGTFLFDTGWRGKVRMERE
ncbi:MAG: hypothetical protein KDC76_05180 [Bacteroidetes bacterium]|nr:hypothetical protein [Bacteroidota bacterium]